MRQFIYYVLSSLIVTGLLIMLIFFSVILYPQNVFDTSYASVIQTKFRVLCDTDEPKIIMVAGSSSAFGLNEAMLEESTGYKVVNLGLHAGFGQGFYSELVKANLNSGDIVLLGYEPGWNHRSFDTIGVDLVMAGIDDNIEMYRYMKLNWFPQILGNIFSFAYKKNNFEAATGFWSSESFDSENGHMIVWRDEVADYNENNSETMGIIQQKNGEIDQACVDYLIDYKEYIEKKGASVYFVQSPMLENAIWDIGPFVQIKENVETKIGIRYISNPEDYLFPAKYMTSDPNHPNSYGEELRTKLLIEDLKNAGVIDVE